MIYESQSFAAIFVVVIAQTTLAQENSTWQTVQKQIFDRQCVSCHAARTYFARQSGLVLTNDVAYNRLVNAAPTNAAAKSDGLLRLGTKGLESLYKSYLSLKCRVRNDEHKGVYRLFKLNEVAYEKQKNSYSDAACCAGFVIGSI